MGNIADGDDEKMEGLRLDQKLLDWIINNIEGIKYGTVLITIHDGKIVQVDRTERFRKVSSSLTQNDYS